MADANIVAHERQSFQSRTPSASGFSVQEPSAATFSNNVGFPPIGHQPHSPATQYSQLHPNKRARLSPGTQSALGSPNLPSITLPQSENPADGMLANGQMMAPTRPGSMGPPSRPVEKATDIRTLEDPLAGTGVNIDDEERNLTAATTPQYGQPAATFSFQSHRPGVGVDPITSTRGRHDPGVHQDLGPEYVSNVSSPPEEVTPEEATRQKESAAHWEAAKHAQHALWNMFLLGDPLQKKLNERSYEHGIKSPQDGLYFATKGPNHPPQRTQVNGLDGARKIIDQGETILSTVSGDHLGDIMKLLSLACKERVTGLVDLSARLSQERRTHSQGRVPSEWKSVAAVPPTFPGAVENAASPSSVPTPKSMLFIIAIWIRMVLTGLFRKLVPD